QRHPEDGGCEEDDDGGEDDGEPQFGEKLHGVLLSEIPAPPRDLVQTPDYIGSGVLEGSEGRGLRRWLVVW
ncbi:MAG: hypothetical protein KC613_00695, partial [Myxococcales bacterium]|nr:hypothetical protein [Myxococcales bacterium]